MKKVLSLLKEIIFVICFPFVLIGYCSFAFSVSYIIFFSFCKVLQDNVMGFLGDNFSMILSVFVSIIVAFHYASFMYKRFWNTDVKEKPKEELAKKLHMKREQYRRYETGINEIKASHIIMFAKFYNVSTDYILGLTDNPNKEWNIKNQNIIYNNYGKIDMK